MTIITKPITEKSKVEKGEHGIPLVVSDKRIERGSGANRNDLSEMEMELWLSPSVRRRISASATVCIFITILLVMSVCIIGGVFLYRQIIHHQKMSRFVGWCGIPYEKDTLQLKKSDFLLGGSKPFFKENDAEFLGSRNLFKEEFDIDLDTGLYEKIDVPDFGYGRTGQFLHDFKTNKTGIIDVTGGQCFVLPLDRTHIQPPKSMMDMVTKMWLGYYSVDTSVIRKKMRVVRPAIDDLNTQGSYIAHHCANYPTYLLAEIGEVDEKLRRKRSVAEEPCVLVEFAGNGIVEYEII